MQEKFPDLDPLTVRFTDLHRYVTELEGFADDPAKSNESRLEAIQMAWHEEFQDAKTDWDLQPVPRRPDNYAPHPCHAEPQCLIASAVIAPAEGAFEVHKFLFLPGTRYTLTTSKRTGGAVSCGSWRT